MSVIDILDTRENLKELYEEDPRQYDMLDRYHLELGEAVLGLNNDEDMLTADELEDHTDLSFEAIQNVVDAWYQLDVIEAEEDDLGQFYNLKSYDIRNQQVVHQALVRFDPTNDLDLFD